ncbi:conserved hypothetical protein [Treponema primitia ZAS-2]|uniref:Bacteriophage T5 Orf172 DNA-binding domain-containing protein n=1 Tax=Treponema primitia (strain ATCC BAA-887 / DSM 12427 / ZAS-2) TaxID=545694 RepID=D8L143_TREPZ|nr:GIY-YIG nuclease family protein [Treponema primitia]ADJ19587.1 hypothetical protein [Treponema primitia ZAS-2]AEF86015.1 conserved hypothetical protein [Treponema primitia ZAS-2]
MENANGGFVYVLVSQNTNYIKIGGTDYPPLKRIKEINATEPYKQFGPWALGDFRQVNDWRKVEYNLHYIFRSKLVKEIEGQKELFSISLYEASIKLNEIDPNEIIRKPKVDRMFQDDDFSKYIMQLFSFTGLLHWLDIQGIWTFVLFPMTNGGRYYTINIGPHEVAFSTLNTKNKKSTHMILMDKLVFDYKPVIEWVKNHNGNIQEEAYDRALPRSVSIVYEGDFNVAEEFMHLDGIRRAIIAYWTESLILLKEKGVASSYAKHHNYNAIAELNIKMKQSGL